MINIGKKQKSFAMIYTLFIVILLMIGVSVTLFTGLTDIRLQRKNEYSAQAYQLAKAGIDDGWVAYKNAIDSTSPLPDKNVPDLSTACNSASASYNRVDLSTYPPTKTIINSLTTSSLPNLSQTIVGVYDYRACGTGLPKFIEGIGYFKGNKITLRARINHDNDINNTTCDTQMPPVCTIDHNDDYMTIYQTGPSQ